MMNGSADIPVESIQIGAKSDVYFVVQYESEKRFDIPDDCGAWDSLSGTTVYRLFTVSSENKMKNVSQKNEQICAKKIVKKKITYVPMEPQPEDIIT
ncbi:hypothetical protein DPMN_159722 [Dreissena polymorpha]|uniref:Uncharacterized protein n=1 Tax=Dreissena polymorpha TaxID=45954 RepID=A0A9D4EPQ6_DREPO|nr:hypothetical protein DPMN_159722 [Dreissena polymorpha]